MRKDSRLILFTFDYELFLGRKSGKVTECLIAPTNRLLALLNDYQFKAVFFVDTVYMSRLKEAANIYPLADKDYKLLLKQLITIVRAGHEIQPHIHPHWLDAIYDEKNNEWSLSEKRYYQFSSLSPQLRSHLFSLSIDIIKGVLNTAQSDQKIDSYRAGGWSIQPFESFRPFFTEYGIKNDFSVIPGKYLLSDAHSYDFRNATTDAVYNFSDDVCVKNNGGPFKEWTISCFSFNKVQKWTYFKTNGIYVRLQKRTAKLGSTVDTIIKEEGDIYVKKGGNRRVASFEQLNPYIVWYYSDMIKRSNYYQFISHPKLISDADFKMIGMLFRLIKKMSGIETDFRKVA
jgi:peptidoglycan/xylan/chitin deacetylase (PgdA/CDA1 family)